MVWLVKAIYPAIKKAGFNHNTQDEIVNLFPALRKDLGNYEGREALPLLAAMAT